MRGLQPVHGVAGAEFAGLGEQCAQQRDGDKQETGAPKEPRRAWGHRFDDFITANPALAA
jgi:hypothetical protein